MFTEPEVARIERRGGHALAIGAVAGAGAALLATAAAAKSYGENERGRFCTGCLVQWSTVSVPVGAAVGALIGWGIGRANARSVYLAPGGHSSVALVPVLSPSRIGALAYVRF